MYLAHSFFQVCPDSLVYVKNTIIQNVDHMAFRFLKISQEIFDRADAF